MKTFFRKRTTEIGGFPGAALLLISVFITYCCAQTLEWDEAGNLITHSYSVWGDWSAHFTYISQFRERGLGWVFGDNPLFQSVPFQYPFLSHFFTQAFASLGSGLGFWESTDVVRPTFILSLCLIFLLPFMLFFGFRAMTLKPLTSVMSTFIFLFVGGLQFLDTSLNPNQPMTNQAQPGGPFFTHFLSFEFFPQRAFLFGLVAFLALGGWIMRNPNRERIGVGVILFPFFLTLHVHTWIALVFVLASLFFFPPNRKDQKNYFFFGAIIAVISLVLMKVYLFRSPLPDALKYNWSYFSPGWIPDLTNPIWFWLYQTGIFIPMAGYGFYLVRHNRALKPYFITGASIFVFAFFFRLQPAAYDNMKLFTYSFLFLTPFVAFAIESFFKKKILIPLGLALLLSLTLSGMNDTLFLTSKKETTTFFSKTEFDLAAEWRMVRASSTDLVMIVPKHNHWVTTLAGSPVWMGYPGWLWSWGINYAPRELQLVEVFTGGPRAKEIIDSNHIHYAIFDPREHINKKPINALFFKENYKLIFEKNGWAIFDLTGTPAPISPSSSVRR